MRVYTTVPQGDLRGTAAAARAAEQAGFDGLVTMENRHEPFLPLAVAATATERVSLATGVAISFPRSPMVVANASWDLQETSQGRFVLGLGSQVKGHNERRFSVPWTPAAPRMREYVEALRAIWRCWHGDGKLDYVGKHYRFTLMTPGFTPPNSGQPMVPITIAAVGEAMLRVAGQVCDGVRLHPFCTRGYLTDVCLPQLNEGLARQGRERRHFELSGGGFLATGPDEAAVRKSMDEVRYRIAFYGSTRTYWPVLHLHGLHDLGAKLHRMVAEGQWDKIAAEVPDDVVHLFAAVGTWDQLAAAVEQRFGGLVDTLSTGMLPSTDKNIPADLVQDIRRIPSVFEGFRTEW